MTVELRGTKSPKAVKERLKITRRNLRHEFHINKQTTKQEETPPPLETVKIRR